MSSSTITLLKGKIDLILLKSKISRNTTIYVLDNDSHKLLSKNSISHEIADKKLTDKEADMIFDKAVSLYDWYDQILNNDEFKIDGINFFSILDTMELHTFLVNYLYDFVIVKRIIEERAPKKIIVSNSLNDVILPLFRKHNFEYELLQSTETKNMVYDSIEIKFNLGKMSFSFYLSRDIYLKLKNFMEKTICRLYNLWPSEHLTKKSLLFLEMDPVEYEYLINELTNNGIQILFFNNRKPAVWNRKSVEILRRYGCKIIDPDRLLSQNEKREITDIVSRIKNKLVLLKNNSDIEKIFTYNDDYFWGGINEKLLSTFESRAEWYVYLLKGAKKTLTGFNIKSIISLNVVGETEKTVLALNKNIIPSLMLEHAFANYLPEISRYDILSMYPLFKDRIVVWGEMQKSYLMKQHGIKEEQIIVTGSPRHDIFFNDKSKLKNKEKIVLITLRPIIDIALHKKVELYHKYEKILEKILKYFERKNEVKAIIKIHPSINSHNLEIKKIIQRSKTSVSIYQNTPIKNLISISCAHINVSPEGFDLSTVILESLILDVPVMNITLDEKNYDFEINKIGAIMNVSNDSVLEECLEQLIFDNHIRKKLIQNGQKFLQKYLINAGNASKTLAEVLLDLQS